MNDGQNTNTVLTDTFAGLLKSAQGQSRRFHRSPMTSGLPLPAQPVDATQALNLSAGVSNCKVSRGRSFS
jgi:hypothetical protein